MFAASGARPARTITPALAAKCVSDTETTRATMAPSPASGRLMNWNASAVPQMSAPALVSV